MTLHLLSADHRTQGLDLVARLGADGAATALGPAVMERAPSVRGALVLATCNRLAVLLDAHEGDDGGASAPGAEELRAAVAAVMCERVGLPPDAVELSSWSGHDAHVELLATASGLTSMVVGEREIAGQLRRAMIVAGEQGTVSADLGRAVEHASTTSRRVASETGLAGTGRSVVSVGLDLAAHHLPPLERARAVVVGTGAYAGATVTALRARHVTDIDVYSRSDRAQAFARGRGLRAVDETGLAECLQLADLVVTCRGLGAPVLTRELVLPAVRTRQPHEPALFDRGEELGSRAEPPERNLVILDLALTRDVDISVGSLPGVHLIDLPSVQRAVPAAEARQVARARAIVEEEVRELERVLDGRRMDPVVTGLRRHVSAMVEDEVARLRVHDGAVDAEDAARALRHLAARILHHPTTAARVAGEEEREAEYLAALPLLLGRQVAEALGEGIDPPDGVCPVPHAGSPAATGTAHGAGAASHGASCVPGTAPARPSSPVSEHDPEPAPSEGPSHE